MAAPGEYGTLGTVKLVLAEWLEPDEQYQRAYRPVTPSSREIPGSPDAVAPDTTIANWRMDDWSRGEGDRRWKDRGRYYTSVGLQPDTDSEGITLGFAASTAQFGTGGAGNFTQCHALGRGAAGSLLAARDMNGSLWAWDDTNDDWDSSWNMSGGAGDDAIRIASPIDSAVYVLDDNNDVEKITSGASSDWITTILTFVYDIVAYEGLLYALGSTTSGLANLYEIDQSSANTLATDGQKSDEVGLRGSTRQYVKLATTSDVGVIWYNNLTNGQSFVYEYNLDDDVVYKIGELPKDVTPFDIHFFAGIYFVSYRYTIGAQTGEAWLYYNAPQGEGVVGPIGASVGDATDRVAIAGVVGDRLYIADSSDLWAYDLSNGGISQTHSGVFTSDTISAATTYGRDIFISESDNSINKLIETDKYDISAGLSLRTGLFDFGYLGLNKILTRVTATLEEPLTDPDAVTLGYAVDGGSFTDLSPAMDNADGNNLTWPVSTNASTIRGVEFELRVKIDGASSARTPKIVALDAEAMGAEDRLEWTLVVDVASSSTQTGTAVLDSLHTLKTTHNVVQFQDPWLNRAHQGTDDFDVQVIDVTLPREYDDEDQGMAALVRLRAVAPI
jgi:hypothetical protein